jgi:SAM-dependent methyltransferase
MGEQSGWQVAGTAPEMMERYIGPAFATTYAELVALAALHGGERVLDVACGTGGVTRRAAQAVGAAGKVVGLDVNEGMLSMARTVPQRHDGPPIEWHHSDAAALPFPAAAFDVVFCQYGLEFFADGAAGFRRVHIRITTNLIRYPSLEEYVLGYLSATPMTRDIAAMDDTARTALLQEVTTALREYVDDDGLAAPTKSHVVVAQT